MNTQIQKYVPSKKTVIKKSIKLAFISLAILSMFGTYWFAKQSYNVQCGFSGKTYGYAMSKAKCHELAEYFQDSLDHAMREQERVANNQAAIIELEQ